MSSSLHEENGYYSVLKEGLEPQTLQAPVNIYNKESIVMKNVDDFQQKYARFLRCSNANSSENVSPKCDPTNDGINSLNTAYQNVMYSINDLNAGLKNIDRSESTGMTNDEYKQSKRESDDNYEKILSLRKQLDTKLETLYNEQKKGRESSTAQLDSTIYANTLWTILATCLLYYIIVEL